MTQHERTARRYRMSGFVSAGFMLALMIACEAAPLPFSVFAVLRLMVAAATFMSCGHLISDTTRAIREERERRAG